MVRLIDALVLRCADLEASEGFYRALGLPPVREQHGDGPVHFSCELGELHFALYPASDSNEARLAPSKNEAGASMVGFRVDSVDDTFAAVLKAGGTEVLAPDDYPWAAARLSPTLTVAR